MSTHCLSQLQHCCRISVKMSDHGGNHLVGTGVKAKMSQRELVCKELIW